MAQTIKKLKAMLAKVMAQLDAVRNNDRMPPDEKLQMTASLSSQAMSIQAQILDLLDELREELGMAMLLITHDLGVVARSAERVAVMYGGRIVETGGVDAMFAAPAHPYTAALLASAPSIETVERLEPIKGSPPNLIAPPPGCAFNPRCTHIGELCTKIRPELVTSAPGRAFACHYPLLETARVG